METSKINQYIKKNWRTQSDVGLAKNCGVTVNAVRHRRRQFFIVRDEANQDKLYRETRLIPTKTANKKVKELTRELEQTKKDLGSALLLKASRKVHQITKQHGKSGEAVIFAVASDWHVEEEVRPAQVNEINKYSLDIAKQRADHFFTTLLRLVEIERQNTTVDTLVLALLGDFITGNIHEDSIRSLEENEALIYAQELLVSGIKFLLKNSDLKIICPCHSGNHARITKKQRITTEHQNSQEWLMYKTIAHIFADEPRITFNISEGYHSYLTVFDNLVRFHHGHQIKYQGGVGGITIPVNKAIAQWNRIRPVMLDVFGHFHTAFDGGNFMSNGSMIGFNAFALSIKASPEPPQQLFFGIHSTHGKYITRYIKFPI